MIVARCMPFRNSRSGKSNVSFHEFPSEETLRIQWITNISRKAQKKIRYGVPFIVFLLAASFGVREFTKLRYEFRKSEMLIEEDFKRLGMRKKKVTIEEEFEKYKKIDLDSWENIRGPRPWEEGVKRN